MQAVRETIYGFKAKWFDQHAQMHRNFNVRYFQDSHHVEILDCKTNKLFLKKTECPASVVAKDFFLGGKVVLFGRHFELTEYLDSFTAGQLSKQAQKSAVLLTHLPALGALCNQLAQNQLTLSYIKLFLRERTPTVIVEVVGDTAVERLPHVVATVQARFNQPFEVATSALEAQQLHDVYVEKSWPSPATFTNCTCCVIQPHVLKEGHVGAVLDAILECGLSISAMELFTLDRASASEFLELYDGVVPHFNEAVDHLTSGPCIALELHGPGQVVERFREIAGPWDIDMARELKPSTIRARFGHDRVQNAVHCTDLPEDGVLESQYFFEILARK
ncbi:nucleoside diphosphate kinase [Achlya hypogyna]|uniref:Nucleoside diphosphate kinase n=1 Tax=Achlya hypogyna TaxID=1202772 RepID=A0A1V9Z8D9_ACHHY|nr:nucleoside diphosphate kinase [Achlya hypogyna]